MEPPKLLTLGERTLAVAITQLGKGELGGNNGGADVARYKGRPVTPGNMGAWCASFVSWCMEEADSGRDEGGYLLGWDQLHPMWRKWHRKRHGAKALYRMIGKAGLFVTDPEPGDVVCWDRGKKGSWQGHIELIETAENGVIGTIAGNVGRFPSLVKRMEHDIDRQPRLIGFARMP